MSNLQETKAFGTAPFEAFTTVTGSSTKGLQAIVAETMDYSKKSFEKSRAHFEKLMGVKKIDEAFQLQSEFAKSAYEDFVAQATKIGELYSSLAKEAFKPIMAASPAQPSVGPKDALKPIEAVVSKVQSGKNWDVIAGNWKQFAGKIKQTWGKLTDDDLAQINGNREKLESKLLELYGDVNLLHDFLDRVK